MPTYYNARKAAQIIAFFATKEPNNAMDVLKVVKLVYLSDRLSLELFGFPMLDEKYVSMEHGPVNSTTLNHITGLHSDNTEWRKFISAREGNQIKATANFAIEDLDELSEADVECMESIWNKYGHLGKYQIRDLTHDKNVIPEWEDPNGASVEIPLERILYAVGSLNPAEQAGEIRSQRNISAFFNS